MKTLKKRRKQGKTDYGKRIKLLKGGKPRIVFRKTNRYLNAQYVESREAKDKIIFGVSSKQLMKYGWPKESEGSLKSTSASYLTGYLIGKEVIGKKLQEPIIDFGMLRMLHKTKVYGFLKGLIEAGIKIKCDEKMFPIEDRIQGKHMKKDFSKIFEEIKSKINGK